MVAVYADRSAELVVAELAVLLAGAAYLPLDPAHPAARTSEVLALSGAAAVISTGPLLSGGAPLGDDPEVVDLAQVPPAPPAVPARPDDATLAYVIFTSGSTGRPKGVAVSHGSLANLMRWRKEAYPLGPQDRTTLLCSPGFDVAVWDTWPTLAAGGTLVVPPARGAHLAAGPRRLAGRRADHRDVPAHAAGRGGARRAVAVPHRAQADGHRRLGAAARRAARRCRSPWSTCTGRPSARWA